MQIHELKVESKKPRKVIGRGGRRGTYSGRGMNGQGSRSGSGVDPLFEGGRSSLIQRLKKLRGFKSIYPKKVVIDLFDLDKFFLEGERVSLSSLIEKKLLRKKFLVNGVKLVSEGNLSKKLIISSDVLLTKKAREKIEYLGGTIES